METQNGAADIEKMNAANAARNRAPSMLAGKPQDWQVFDMNQRGEKPRMHEIVLREIKAEDGTVIDVETKAYELYAHKATLMPMDHALKFLIDAAYKVVRPNGGRVIPIPKFDPSKPLTQLSDDEIVVKHGELSLESLMKRVKMLPFGDEYGDESTSEQLAQALTNWNKRKKGMTEGDRKLAELATAGQLGGQLSQDVMARLMPAPEGLMREANRV